VDGSRSVTDATTLLPLRGESGMGTIIPQSASASASSP
jgi:hypothetical protein